MTQSESEYPTEVTEELQNPRLKIGDTLIPAESIERVKLTVTSDALSSTRQCHILIKNLEGFTWDFRSFFELYEDDDLKFRGICASAEIKSPGNLSIEVRGPTWEMQQTEVRELGFFGMPHLEMVHWTGKIAGPSGGINVLGLELNEERRPFAFAVPIDGISMGDSPSSIWLGDAGISVPELDNVFRPILDQMGLSESKAEWGAGKPFVWGILLAQDLFEADKKALQKAKLVEAFVRFAFKSGNSHFESRFDSTQLAWDSRLPRAPVSLHPWILVREVNPAKGWVRRIPSTVSATSAEIENFKDRIEIFAEQLSAILQIGDAVDESGRRNLSNRERKLARGAQRALRWMSAADDELEPTDKLLALWTSFESLLGSIDYPKVFGGARANFRKPLLDLVDELCGSVDESQEISISSQMLRNRILNGQWPTTTKLSMFARSFGISLTEGDETIVSRLARIRGGIVHAGEFDVSITDEDLRALRYMIERLLASASFMAYRDLERRFRLSWGPIGSELGAAPLYVDGDEVGRRWGMQGSQDPVTKEQQWEIVAAGHVFDSRNSIHVPSE